MRVVRYLVLAVLVFGWGGPARAGDNGFAKWRDGFRDRAIAAGITPATFDRAFAGVEPLPSVIAHDRAQPETHLAFDDYVRRLASPSRRAGVREHLAQNRELLAEIGRHYGVQPRFIVALWGVETDFGRASGGYPVIASLATLAYDGRRAALFNRELIAALRIVQRDHIDPKQLRGSWAGAMGQCQFMPSSFLAYAVSYRRDGLPDIWHRRADIFASIANYLARLGWRDDQTWGRYVRVPRHLPESLVGLHVERSLEDWRRLGLRRADGGPLPVVAGMKASLLMPEGSDGPKLLVYGNFRILLRWNNSQAFATSVGLLADAAEIR